MAFTSLESERSLSELSEKLYKDLTAEKRKEVEVALLKENPKLSDFSRLKPGTLVIIPQIKGLELKKTRDIANPEGDLLDDFINRVAIFNNKLADDNAKKDREQKTMQALLKNAAITKLINSDERAKQIADSLNEYLAADAKKRKENEKNTQSVIATLKKDLQ